MFMAVLGVTFEEAVEAIGKPNPAPAATVLG
jgi:hypothetical protein